MKKLVLFLAILTTCAYHQAGAQSIACPEVDIQQGSDLTLPCGQACTQLSATMPDIRTTDSYTVDSMDYNGHYPFNITGGTSVSVGTDDIYSPKISLPFKFCFYGATYTAVKIGSNGVITFDSTTTGGCPYDIGGIGGYPNTGYAKAEIAIAYHDIDPSILSSNPVIQYYLTGTAPCRKLIVNFDNVSQWYSGNGCSIYQSTFQAILYENTNVIEIYIQDKPACVAAWQGGAICGLQDWTQTQAITAPGKNGTVWGSAGCDLAYRFVPSGTSLLQNVSLMENGAVVATTIPIVTNPGELTATFSSVCPADSNAQYIIQANYNPCSGTALSAADTINIHRHDTLPAPVVVSPVFYCQNATAIPLIATGDSLRWYSSIGGTASYIAPTPNTSVPDTTTYYVTQTANGCESQPASIEVDVDGATPPTVVSPVFYCLNAPADALEATGTSLHWYNSATGGIPGTATPVPSTATAGTANFYVTQTDVAGCESDRSIISVTTYPATPLPAVISPVVYCQYLPTVPLSATGTNLQWYATATGGTGSAAVPTPASDTAGNYTYYVSQTVNGCEGPRAAITVTINAKPAAPVVTANVEYCQGLPAVPLVAAGQNLGWYMTATGGTPGTGTPTPSTAIAGTTDYYVTQTILGCESDRAQIEAVIHPAVAAGISFSKSPACSTDSVQIAFSGVAQNDATYNWNFGGANIITGSGAGPYSVQFPQQDTFTVALRVTSQYGCTDSTSSRIVVNTPPVADFILTPSVCVDQLIDIQPANDALYGTGYDWSFEDGDVLFGNNSGVYMVQWHTPGVKTVSLTMQSGVCQSNVLTKTIVVHGRPVAQILPLDNTSTCIGDTLTFTAGNVDSANLYAWEPESSFADSVGVMRRGIIKSASAYMTLNVTDIYGCKASDSILITAQQCCQVILPSAFTPNGDGLNDVFHMKTDGHHVLQTFRIMNRWGQIVFNTQDEHTGWDGIFNGVPQDIGTYTYYVKYTCDGKSMTQQGDVILIR